MKFNKVVVLICTFFLICVAISNVRAGQSEKPKSSEIQFITAEELKEKVAGNRKVTIIDLRASKEIIGSDKRIKGAIRVKLRRLNYRLSFKPLKDVSRDSEIVTYC